MRKLLSLDWIVNVLLALTCVVVLATYVSDRWSRSHYQPPAVKPESLSPGKQIPGLSSVVWKDRNILLFVRSTCRFCTESMSFYRDLSAQVHDSGVRFIAVADEPQDVTVQYLRSYGVAPDEVISASGRTTGVLMTPALAIVDKRGSVIQSWVGKIPPEKEPNVRLALAARSAVFGTE
jgi:peroxiredoxin